MAWLWNGGVEPSTATTVKLFEASWNVTAQAQNPHFFFRRNGRVHLNRRGASVQSTTGSRGVCISGSNAGYTMFRGSVKSTGYPLHLNRREGGASVQSTTGSRGVRISGSNAGYTMFRGSVKSTGYPLHSQVSPSLPLPCVSVYHHISTGVYLHRALVCILLPREVTGPVGMQSLPSGCCCVEFRVLYWEKKYVDTIIFHFSLLQLS